jgi:hypothetical protein
MRVIMTDSTETLPVAHFAGAAVAQEPVTAVCVSKEGYYTAFGDGAGYVSLFHISPSISSTQRVSREYLSRLRRKQLTTRDIAAESVEYITSWRAHGTSVTFVEFVEFEIDPDGDQRDGSPSDTSCSLGSFSHTANDHFPEDHERKNTGRMNFALATIVTGSTDGTCCHWRIRLGEDLQIGKFCGGTSYSRVAQCPHQFCETGMDPSTLMSLSASSPTAHLFALINEEEQLHASSLHLLGLSQPASSGLAISASSPREESPPGTPNELLRKKSHKYGSIGLPVESTFFPKRSKTADLRRATEKSDAEKRLLLLARMREEREAEELKAYKPLLGRLRLEPVDTLLKSTLDQK